MYDVLYQWATDCVASSSLQTLLSKRMQIGQTAQEFKASTLSKIRTLRAGVCMQCLQLHSVMRLTGAGFAAYCCSILLFNCEIDS